MHGAIIEMPLMSGRQFNEKCRSSRQYRVPFLFAYFIFGQAKRK